MLKKIENLSNRDLIAMLVENVKRDHYDPCDSMKIPAFSRFECEDELMRRIALYV